MAPIDIDWRQVLGGGESASSRTASDEDPRRGVARRHPGLADLRFPSPRRRRRAPFAAAKADDGDCEGGGGGSTPKKSRKFDTEKEDALYQMPGEINKSVQASSKPAEPPQVPQEEALPEEIFAALKEIPDLARADLLRAYSMFIRDDRLFRSLLALPKDMRKDWLLMEIGNNGDWSCLPCKTKPAACITIMFE